MTASDNPESFQETERETYPQAHAGSSIDIYHGIDVPAPYRWMEQLGSQGMRDWLQAQNELTDRLLPRDTEWEKLQASFAAMPAFVPQRLPLICGERTFWFAQAKDSTQPALMMQHEGSERIVLLPGHDGLDPAMRIYLEFVYPSADGRYVAFAGSYEAADMQSIFIWDVDARRLLDEVVDPTCNPVVSWIPGIAAFCYNVSRTVFADSEVHSQQDGVYRHTLASDPLQDRLLFEYRDGAGHAALPWVAPDGRTLFVKTINFVTQQAGLYFRELEEHGQFHCLFEDGEAMVNIAGIEQGHVFPETNWKSPNSRILGLCLAMPGRDAWYEIVAEREVPIARTTHRVISDTCCIAGGRLFVTYLEDVCNRIEVFRLQPGRQSLDSSRQVEIPDYSSVLQLQPAACRESLNIAVSSFLVPFKQLRFDIASGTTDLTQQLDAGLETGRYQVNQVFCESRDGTRIPLFIIRPLEPPETAEPAVLLYGYGGWGQAISPAFFPDLVAWIRQGGVYVVANIRGGGEYGQLWHQAGKLLNKQNVFDDFCSVAQYLREEGIAAPGKLAIRGLSNGGLLTTACVNQRPDLFDAAIAEVPLVDVVHLMDTAVGGPVAMELGDPTADQSTFQYMHSYSPLQNVNAHPLRPPVLVVVGAEDERALPHFSYQYVAAMQASSGPGQMVLLRTIAGEGHTAWPWQTIVTSLCEELRFLLMVLGEEGSSSRST